MNGCTGVGSKRGFGIRKGVNIMHYFGSISVLAPLTPCLLLCVYYMY